VPGVAASPWSPEGLRRLIRFKQRPGPFLVLAGSVQAAARLAPFFTPELRRLMHDSWPGRTTLVFRGCPGLPVCCYQRGEVAVRVDASDFVRALSRHCGGYVLSSSLNRRGGITRPLTRSLRWRWQRHLAAVVPGAAGAGSPSTMLRLRGRRIHRLR
jgi:L-threonylcarbamoyladenylate synthase